MEQEQPFTERGPIPRRQTAVNPCQREIFDMPGKILILSLVLASLTARGARKDSDFAREQGAPEGRVLRDALEGGAPPPLQVDGWINTDGDPPVLADLKGKVVVVRIWATWCGACRRSVPEVKRIYEAYAPRGLVVLGIHTTHGGENAAAFVKEKGITWPVAVDVNDKTAQSLGAIRGKPDYYLVDRKGILRFADLEEGELERAVKMLLEEAP